jgi:hypothetical protein
MVVQLYRVLAASVGILLGQSHDTPITRLPPAARAKLIGSLILLTIGGVALVVLSWLALRVGRRYLNRSEEITSLRSPQVHRDDWADKPLLTRPGARPDSDET